MKKVVRRHYGNVFENKEIYEIKLKDKPDQAGFRIRKENDEMILKEIRIIKVPKKNNQLIIELYHSGKDIAKKGKGVILPHFQYN